MSNLTILRAYFKDVWEGCNTDALYTYLHPDLKAHGPIDDMETSLEDFASMVLVLIETWDKVGLRIVHAIEQDDWVSAKVALHFESAELGVNLELPGYFMGRFKDQKLIEMHQLYNSLQLYAALGQVPQDTHVLLMSGVTLQVAE